MKSKAGFTPPPKRVISSVGGFTLVELMIYAGLTAMVMGLFGAILITILRVQGEQSSSSQVSSELNFLMTTMKRHIHEAVDINLTDSAHITLVKDTGTAPETRTIINYDSVAKNINLTEEGPPPVPSSEQISSDRILIESLTFEQLQDPDPLNPKSTAIRITITASANTTDPARQSQRTLQGTAAPFLQSQ